MSALSEDRIAKISWGLLVTMLTGLVGGTAYIVRLSYASDAHTAAIGELQSNQAVVQQMRVDLAVIKDQLDRIEKKVGD